MMPIVRNAVLFGLVLWAPSFAAFAEVRCWGEVSYQWKKKGAETPISVVVGAVQAEGAEEASVKLQLESRSGREKGKALEICRKEHENISQCISTKYQVGTGLLQSLDFAARKAIGEAIKSDCEAAQGECGLVSLGEVKCEQIAAASASPEAAAAPAKAKK